VHGSGRPSNRAERQRRIDYSKSRRRSGARVPACIIGRRARRRQQQQQTTTCCVAQLRRPGGGGGPRGGGAARRQSVHAQQQYNRAHVLHRGARQSAAAPPQIARYDRRPTPDRSFAAVANRPALPSPTKSRRRRRRCLFSTRPFISFLYDI